MTLSFVSLDEIFQHFLYVFRRVECVCKAAMSGFCLKVMKTTEHDTTL